LYARWLGWATANLAVGGCLFSSAAWEFDDRPGPVRDRLAEILGDWVEALERAVTISVEEGHLRSDLDTAEIAQHIHSLQLGMHLHTRLFKNPEARERAEHAFERLLLTLRP
jgi:hypothetical protein